MDVSPDGPVSHCLEAGVQRQRRYYQCRINNGANGAAAPGPPQLGAPTKDFFFAHEANFIYIIAKMRSLPDPAGGLTAPPRPPAVLHAASGSVGLGHRGSHSPREKPPTKVLHQAPHIDNPALNIIYYQTIESFILLYRHSSHY